MANRRPSISLHWRGKPSKILYPPRLPLLLLLLSHRLLLSLKSNRERPRKLKQQAPSNERLPSDPKNQWRQESKVMWRLQRGSNFQNWTGLSFDININSGLILNDLVHYSFISSLAVTQVNLPPQQHLLLLPPPGFQKQWTPRKPSLSPSAAWSLDQRSSSALPSSPPGRNRGPFTRSLHQSPAADQHRHLGRVRQQRHHRQKVKRRYSSNLHWRWTKNGMKRWAEPRSQNSLDSSEDECLNWQWNWWENVSFHKLTMFIIIKVKVIPTFDFTSSFFT